MSKTEEEQDAEYKESDEYCDMRCIQETGRAEKADAIALIKGYGRRVPRAMLEEISDMGDPLLNDLRKERMPAIAAKYGYIMKE